MANELVERREIADRKREVIDRCLNTLITKGLAETSVRDLSASLELKKAGIYWYFKDKDDAIVVCAEEAANRLESELILPALMNIEHLDDMWCQIRSSADKLAPTMKFFAQVCSSPRYQKMMVVVLSRLSERYKSYAKKFAEKLGIDTDRFEPYFYICVSAVSNYMLFNDEAFLIPPKGLMKRMIDNC